MSRDMAKRTIDSFFGKKAKTSSTEEASEDPTPKRTKTNSGEPAPASPDPTPSPTAASEDLPSAAAAEPTPAPPAENGAAAMEEDPPAPEPPNAPDSVFPLPALPPAWHKALGSEFKKPYFKRLVKYVEARKRSGAVVFPPAPEVFTAFELCDLDSVKVVILGQDPYHGPGQAHGLSFSVKAGVAIPPSLRNIFKEAKLGKPKAGDLTGWASQGVLMLNACLTVEQGKANAHAQQGWEQFTDAVVGYLARKTRNVVFLLWGKPAQKKAANVDRHRHTVITSSHPSPLGATKTAEPFIGSRCFERANEALLAAGKEPIDWGVLH